MKLSSTEIALMGSLHATKTVSKSNYLLNLFIVQNN